MQMQVDGSSTNPSTAQLKAQIASELKNKQRCAYSSYKCSQFSLNKYDYCIKHILSDKSAPYRCCSYVYPSGKRCFLAAFKSSKKEPNYCHEHALKNHLASTKTPSKIKPCSSAESMLYSLAHHVQFTKNKVATVPSSSEDDPVVVFNEEEVTRNDDPFSMNVKKILAGSEVAEMHSESDSENESSNFSNTWADADAESSNDDSVDNEHDVLKHSDVYAAEVVTLVAKEKLMQLQSLYIEQYKHLTHVLKEKKRRYLHALKREKETCCSIHSQARDNPLEQEMYKKLKAHNHFHRKRGAEAILRKKLVELRLKITDGVAKPQTYYTKCAFTEGGVKCTERALPVARHCKKHILKDPNQVLFRPCDKKVGDISCLTPIEAIFEDQHCILHRDIPSLKIYSQVRKDSDSDFDETTMDKEAKIKTEINDMDFASNSPASCNTASSYETPFKDLPKQEDNES